MNKADFVSTLAGKAEVSKAKAEQLLAAFQETIQEGLKNDGDVTLRGFGAFAVKDTKEKAGRNPKTGEKIQIPAGRKVAFKAHFELN